MPPENIVDVFTKANAPNFSQVISFITGSKLSAFRTQEHHFELIKEGYVGTYFPQIFDFLKRQFSSFKQNNMSGRGKGKSSKKAVSRSAKAGLQFPVGRIAR